MQQVAVDRQQRYATGEFCHHMSGPNLVEESARGCSQAVSLAPR
jgi:hypothetical protein